MGGCAGAENKKKEETLPAKDKAGVVPAPPQDKLNDVNAHHAQQLHQKPSSKVNAPHQAAPAEAQKHPLPQQPQAPSVHNTLNIAHSNASAQINKEVQSDIIRNSLGYAVVPVAENPHSITQKSPAEPISYVSAEAQDMKSNIDSGIERIPSALKSTSKAKSGLSNILEEDQKVHDEGVSNFATPLKKINLQVEVK